MGLILAGCSTVHETAVVLEPSPAVPSPPIALPGGDSCDAPAFQAAAVYNAAARTNLAFSPFGRPETGWAVYEPQIAETISTPCAADSAGFAKAVAAWQSAHNAASDGALTAETFQILKGVWQERRPFLMLRVKGVCPPGADEAALVLLGVDETLGGKAVMLRPEALAALRRMTEEARRDLPEVSADRTLLAVFSGYRDPAVDTARCGLEHNCQGLVRAGCSAHRTGLAVDLDLGSAPGFAADSSADPNRLYQSQTALYRWLVRNAARFGFVNYVFEPWHWEWTGATP